MSAGSVSAWGRSDDLAAASKIPHPRQPFEGCGTSLYSGPHPCVPVKNGRGIPHEVEVVPRIRATTDVALQSSKLSTE